MKLMNQKSFFFLLFLNLSFLPFLKADVMKNPDRVGESAHYKLDKNSSRTSRIIKTGVVDLSIQDFAENFTNFNQNLTAGSYELNLEFDVDIRFIGRKTENQSLMVNTKFFEPTFIEELKTKKTVHLEQLSIDYIRPENVSTIFNRQYSTHKIRIYNLKSKKFLPQPILLALEKELGTRKGIDPKDIEIFANVTPGVPVLGAVKIDIRLKVSGFNIKMGFDVDPNSVN